MRKATVLFVLLFLTSFSFCREPNTQFAVTIQWKKANGFGSNQCAIWIEDEAGNYIKTLYVSRFTGKGGFLKRPDCLPQWRKKAFIKTFVPPEIDAVTGATPKNGKCSFFWNMKDSDGNLVEPGIYYYCVEANLRFEQRVLWSGKIDTRKIEDNSCADVKYFSTESAKPQKITVTGVSAIYSGEKQKHE